jgi:hypothetical protein
MSSRPKTRKDRQTENRLNKQADKQLVIMSKLHCYQYGRKKNRQTDKQTYFTDLNPLSRRPPMSDVVVSEDEDSVVAEKLRDFFVGAGDVLAVPVAQKDRGLHFHSLKEKYLK